MHRNQVRLVGDIWWWEKVMEWDMRGAKIGQGSKSGKGATEVRHGLTSHGHVFCGMKSEDRLFPLD